MNVALRVVHQVGQRLARSVPPRAVPVRSVPQRSVHSNRALAGLRRRGRARAAAAARYGDAYVPPADAAAAERRARRAVDVPPLGAAWAGEETKKGILAAVADAQGDRKFACVYIKGHQFKVTPGDMIVTEKLDAPVNSRVLLKDVLLVASQRYSIIGRPLVTAAAVEVEVMEQFKTGKVVAFKMRRRKNSKRTRGHRQEMTTLRVIDIHLDLAKDLVPPTEFPIMP